MTWPCIAPGGPLPSSPSQSTLAGLGNKPHPDLAGEASWGPCRTGVQVSVRPPKSVPKLVRKRIPLHLPEIEKVKVMELTFGVLNTDTSATLQRKDAIGFSPSLCAGRERARNNCGHTTDPGRLQRAE